MHLCTPSHQQLSNRQRADPAILIFCCYDKPILFCSMLDHFTSQATILLYRLIRSANSFYYFMYNFYERRLNGRNAKLPE